MCRVAFQVPDLSLLYLPKFVAKPESEQNPLPHSFFVKFLVEFVGVFPEEWLLCPVRAVRIYLAVTTSLALRPCSLFMSRFLLRSLSKNSLSYFLRQVISSAGALQGDQTGPPRAHSIRGVATSTAFFAQRVGLRGIKGGNLEINSSLCLFLFA